MRTRQSEETVEWDRACHCRLWLCCNHFDGVLASAAAEPSTCDNWSALVAGSVVGQWNHHGGNGAGSEKWNEAILCWPWLCSLASDYHFGNSLCIHHELLQHPSQHLAWSMNPFEPPPKPNKTDAGNGSNGICRVIDASSSPSPDPKR